MDPPFVPDLAGQSQQTVPPGLELPQKQHFPNASSPPEATPVPSPGSAVAAGRRGVGSNNRSREAGGEIEKQDALASQKQIRHNLPIVISLLKQLCIGFRIK